MARQLLSSLTLSLTALFSTVVGLEQFIDQPLESYFVTEGESLTVVCSYCLPSVYLVWTKNGLSINNGDSGLHIARENFSWGQNSTLSISQANHTLHTDVYACTAISFSNEVNTDFSITVNFIGSSVTLRRVDANCSPRAHEHNGLFSHIAYYNTSFELECIPPQASPAVSIVWFKSGENLQLLNDTNVETFEFSSDGRFLGVARVTTWHFGVYRCEVSNEVNSATPLVSNSIQMLVGDASNVHEDLRTVEIEQSDSVLLVREGQNVKLVCKIVPSAAINVNQVYWSHDKKGHITVNGESIRINMVDCRVNLFLDNVGTNDQGHYTCSVSDWIQTSQRELKIARLEGPLTVEATPSTLVGEGQCFSLKCALSEDASPTQNNVPPSSFSYSWTHNGSLLSEGGSEIHIPAGNLSLSGRYECTVSYPEVDTPISSHVDITVEAKPTITLSPFPVAEVELGSMVTMHCASSSFRPSVFTWFRDDQEISGRGNSHQIISATHNTSSLTLKQLSSTDLSSYCCKVNDTIHYQELQLSLVEVDRLYIMAAGGGVTPRFFPVDTNLILNCTTRGGEAENMTWYKGRHLLVSVVEEGEGEREGGTVEIVTQGNVSHLTIYHVMNEAAGSYSCQIRHRDSGAESRREFEVTITLVGRIVSTSPLNVTATVGDRVQFDCFTTGTPLPTWARRGSLPLGDGFEDLGNGSAVIDPVATYHKGEYLCVVDTHFLIFNLTVRELEGNNGLGPTCGSFSSEECIILFAGGAVASFILLLTLLILTICLCILCHRGNAASHPITESYELKSAGATSKASYRKDNGGGVATTSIGEYGDPFFGKGIYPTSFHLTPYDGSLLSGVQRSVTPPPPSLDPRMMDGTERTDSMFSTEDQSELALPNFPRTQLKLGQELGEGEFGPVILGVARNIVPHEEASQVAVKVLVRNGDGDDQLHPESVLVDFANQMRLEYENVSCILGLCSDTEPYYIIYEYLDQGDLKRYLLSQRLEEGGVASPHPSLTPHVLTRLTLQVADGMAYLFSQRIIHGDLATRNCLVSSDCRVKIADLGIGHDLYTADYYDSGSQLLPIRWMPPELLTQMEDGPSFSLYSDIWSFGVLCWEVFTFARQPFDDWDNREVLEQVPQGELLTMPPQNCPPHMQGVMRECWRQEPEARPHFSQLCMAIINSSMAGPGSHMAS